MPYFQPANNPLNIEEFYYATSNSIRMSNFTSCCGLLVRLADGMIFAAHISLFIDAHRSYIVSDQGGNPIGLSVDGKKAMQELFEKVRMHQPAEVRVVGLDTWRNVLNDVAHWIPDQLLGNRPRCFVNTVEDGALSARMEGGAMLVSYQPKGEAAAVLAPDAAGQPSWHGAVPVEPEEGGGGGGGGGGDAPDHGGGDEPDHGGGDGEGPKPPDGPSSGGDPVGPVELRSQRSA